MMRPVFILVFVVLTGCALLKKQEPPAPLVVDEIYNADFSARFITEVCGASTDISKVTAKQKTECSQKWDAMFNARLIDRYPYASGDTVNRKCAAYPIECKTPRSYELWVKESHEDNLSEHNQYVSDVNKVNLANSLQRMGDSFTKASQNIKEYQRQPGTNCTSQPNGIGGFNTQCN